MLPSWHCLTPREPTVQHLLIYLPPERLVMSVLLRRVVTPFIAVLCGSLLAACGLGDLPADENDHVASAAVAQLLSDDAPLPSTLASEVQLRNDLNLNLKACILNTPTVNNSEHWAPQYRWFCNVKNSLGSVIVATAATTTSSSRVVFNFVVDAMRVSDERIVNYSDVIGYASGMTSVVRDVVTSPNSASAYMYDGHLAGIVYQCGRTIVLVKAVGYNGGSTQPIETWNAAVAQRLNALVRDQLTSVPLRGCGNK
jgi:hypothetical protein